MNIFLPQPRQFTPFPYILQWNETASQKTSTQQTGDHRHEAIRIKEQKRQKRIEEKNRGQEVNRLDKQNKKLLKEIEKMERNMAKEQERQERKKELIKRREFVRNMEVKVPEENRAFAH